MWHLFSAGSCRTLRCRSPGGVFAGNLLIMVVTFTLSLTLTLGGRPINKFKQLWSNLRSSFWFMPSLMVAAINRYERALRAAFPQVRWLFFEPDVES